MAEKQLTADIKWSFSRLSTYAECPFGFWLRYLQDPPIPDEQNAWSEFGTLCHALLEEYALGKLDVYQLYDEYVKRYNSAVKHAFPPFPKGYAEKTYKQGLAYFESFEGFGDQYEIVAAEQRFETKIGPYTMLGITDLVLQDKQDGKLIVVDHKTKSPSSMKHEYPLYRNQLYIYAAYIKDKYGRWPDELWFNMIKDPSASIHEPFLVSQMEATTQWVEDKIDSIYMEDIWPAAGAKKILSGKGDFYCRWICPVFQYCNEAQEAIRCKGKG